MNAHTPGPWTVKSTFVGPLAVCTDERTIAEVGHESFVTAEANAHLIAASPELLEALKEANNELVLRRDSPLRARIDAAIAKAEGK